MTTPPKYKVYKGYNFRVLEIPGFDSICFGCPPGIVKDFSRRNKDLPSKYFLPLRTFVKGKNYFDFEFIVYSFLFVKNQKSKISIYCTSDQKKRFKSIINETLFGPTFKNMLLAQFRKIERNSEFSYKEKNQFRKLISGLSTNVDLARIVKQLLESNEKEKTIHSNLENYFKGFLKNEPWLYKKKIPSIVNQFAKNYFLCLHLKNEMDLFVLAKESDRSKFIDNLVQFHLLDIQESLTISGAEDKRKKLNISQVQPAIFEISVKNKPICKIDILHLDPPPRPEKIVSIEKPLMGVTYLGVGSGFSHNRQNSSLIVWVDGKGIMVDAYSDNNETMLSYGIASNEISYMFLTHVHSDHDSGFIEKILSGQRIKLITSRIIFESFLRKIQGITRFPTEVIESFIDFFEVEPDKRIKLPGFKNTYLDFDYSLHSIPTGRFRLVYRVNGKEKVVSHSGDTKFDIEMVRQWWKQGVFSEKRRDGILGFIWDADLVVQEVGGGVLHTNLGSLSYLAPSTMKKTVLVHQHKDPLPHPLFRFAEEGKTDVLIKQKNSNKQTLAEFLKEVALFDKVSSKELKEIVNGSSTIKKKSGEIVFSKNEVGDSFYIIIEGFAEVRLNRDKYAIYEKGMFFGELAVSTENPQRRGTVRALSPMTLVKIPKRFYREGIFPKIVDEFYHLGNYFNKFIRPGLVASLGFGDVAHWKRGEPLFSNGLEDGQAYVLISGQIKVRIPKRKTVAFLSSGDIMGDLPNWKKFPSVSQISADSDRVLAVKITKNHLGDLLKLYPSFWGTVYHKLKRLDVALHNSL